MKKIIAVLLCFLFVFMAGCRKEPTSVAVKWFDEVHGDEMIWDRVHEYSLDDFPGVTFRWNREKMEAVTDGKTVTLYSGPILSVYFCDLTGDGKPELCSTVSSGSGFVDLRVRVYNYVSDQAYELSDRCVYDYVLNVQDNTLIVEKHPWHQEELLESGKLILRDDALMIKS